jgi:hypothetical protein
MTKRWHLLLAKVGHPTTKTGLTDWQFGAVMTQVAEQYSGLVVREPSYEELSNFYDRDLLNQYHWAVAMDPNVGFAARMAAPNGVEFHFWTDKQMDPTARAIAANPKRYRHWMYVDLQGLNHVRWRYYTPNKTLPNGQKVYFAYSTNRNVAGFFLAWRQLESLNGYLLASDRDQIVASKLRKKVKEITINRLQS